MNAAGFAGHSDWELPSESGCNSCWAGGPPYNCPCASSELETILAGSYPCGTSPCIASIFGPTVAGLYWSATTFSTNPGTAWVVGFDGGGVLGGSKDYDLYVRAVRAGP